MSALRDAILATLKPAPVKVDVPEWGNVFVRILTVGQITEQDEDTKDDANRPAVARAFCRVVCEEDGAPVFDQNKTEDIQAVMGLPWPMVKRTLEKANEVNALRKTEGDEGKA